MIPVSALTDEQRSMLRTGFLARLNRANTSEWRKFWETELLFLDNRSDEAVEKLRELVDTQNREVARAALLSLGEWYEQSALTPLAQQAYMDAIETSGDESSGVLARAKLAGLYNKDRKPKLASVVLENVVATIEDVRPDTVQFVAAEYCQALCRLGRLSDARTFIRRVITSFPERTELPLLEQELFRDPH